MSRRRRPHLWALAAALAAMAALGGCGKLGSLDRPGPLFGHAATTASPEQAQGQDPSRPVTTVDPREISTGLAPPRSAPIQGTSPDPFGQPPPGSLPDPMSTNK
jgi:hypothetical protein